MAFKKGQEVTLFLHGAGVVSEEQYTVELVTAKGVFVDGLDGGFDPTTGRNLEDGVFGFWSEIKPKVEPKAVAKPKKTKKRN